VLFDIAQSGIGVASRCLHLMPYCAGLVEFLRNKQRTKTVFLLAVVYEEVVHDPCSIFKSKPGFSRATVITLVLEQRLPLFFDISIILAFLHLKTLIHVTKLVVVSCLQTFHHARRSRNYPNLPETLDSLKCHLHTSLVIPSGTSFAWGLQRKDIDWIVPIENIRKDLTSRLTRRLVARDAHIMRRSQVMLRIDLTSQIFLPNSNFPFSKPSIPSPPRV